MKTYKIGLIGFGFIGKVHAKCYSSLPYCYNQPVAKAQVTAVLRSHADQDQDLLAALQIPFCTSDEQDFWKQDFDILDICSPNASHFDYAVKAIERGIPIYCEKPITRDIENARILTSLVEEQHIPTHTAFTIRYAPVAHLAKEIMAAGMLGEINHFRAQYFHSSYLDSTRPMSWRLQSSMAGGGALTDLGIHFLDLIRYLMGEAAWIQCQTRTIIESRPDKKGSTKLQKVDVDDWALCTMEMKNGGIGSLEVSRVSGGAGDVAFLEIYGSRGSLKLDLVKRNQIEFFDVAKDEWVSGMVLPNNYSKQYYDPALWPASKQSLGPFMDAHIAAILDFLTALEDQRPSPVDFRTALKAQELLQAAYQSAASQGQKVHPHE